MSTTAAETDAGQAEAATRAQTPALWGAVEKALREDPTSFDFFEAVRQLERLRPGSTPLATSPDPSGEAVQFSVPASIAFPPGDIHSLTLDGPGAARMGVNFLGLTGPSGMLPYHYTLLVLERAAARDTALRDFLDIFHHRLLSLYYRAWEKHAFAAAYARGEDRLRSHLLDLVGIGLSRQQASLPFPADTPAYYAGLLVGRVGSGVALQQLLQDFFEVPVAIEQFVGDWYRIPVRDQCQLGSEDGISASLGLGSIAGDEVWDQQCKVRVRIGPLSRDRYGEFLPGGQAYGALRDLVRVFSRDELDFELQLVLARDEVPGLVLGGDEAEGQPLGWSTWIRSGPFTRDADDAVMAL